VGLFFLSRPFVDDNHGHGPCRPVYPDFCHNQQVVYDLSLALQSPACRLVHLLACYHLRLTVFQPLWETSSGPPANLEDLPALFRGASWFENLRHNRYRLPKHAY
jgi:hypothetical protein